MAVWGVGGRLSRIRAVVGPELWPPQPLLRLLEGPGRAVCVCVLEGFPSSDSPGIGTGSLCLPAFPTSWVAGKVASALALCRPVPRQGLSQGWKGKSHLGHFSHSPTHSSSCQFLLGGMEKARWFLPLLDVLTGQVSSSDMRQAGSVQAVLSEKQSLVCSQPIPFSTNPFVLASRQGPAFLGRPPLGYSQGGLLKPSLYTKAGGRATGVAWCDAAWCCLAEQPFLSAASGSGNRALPGGCLLFAVGAHREKGEPRLPRGFPLKVGSS